MLDIFLILALLAAHNYRERDRQLNKTMVCVGVRGCMCVVCAYIRVCRLRALKPFRSHGLLKEPFLHYASTTRAPKGAWNRVAARYQLLL